MKLIEQEEKVFMPQSGDGAPPASSSSGISANSGIVVFSSTRKPLYVNQGAQQLLKRLHRQEQGHSANEGFPRAIDDLLDEMVPMLQTVGRNNGWTDLKAKRLIPALDRSLLLKAYGIPDRVDVQQSVILLTIQEIVQVS